MLSSTYCVMITEGTTEELISRHHAIKGCCLLVPLYTMLLIKLKTYWLTYTLYKESIHILWTLFAFDSWQGLSFSPQLMAEACSLNSNDVWQRSQWVQTSIWDVKVYYVIAKCSANIDQTDGMRHGSLTDKNLSAAVYIEQVIGVAHRFLQ